MAFAEEKVLFSGTVKGCLVLFLTCIMVLLPKVDFIFSLAAIGEKQLLITDTHTSGQKATLNEPIVLSHPLAPPQASLFD